MAVRALIHGGPFDGREMYLVEQGKSELRLEDETSGRIATYWYELQQVDAEGGHHYYLPKPRTSVPFP